MPMGEVKRPTLHSNNNIQHEYRWASYAFQLNIQISIKKNLNADERAEHTSSTFKL